MIYRNPDERRPDETFTSYRLRLPVQRRILRAHAAGHYLHVSQELKPNPLFGIVLGVPSHIPTGTAKTYYARERVGPTGGVDFWRGLRTRPRPGKSGRRAQKFSRRLEREIIEYMTKEVNHG
jgi:hypothetical protein